MEGVPLLFLHTLWRPPAADDSGFFTSNLTTTVRQGTKVGEPNVLAAEISTEGELRIEDIRGDIHVPMSTCTLAKRDASALVLKPKTAL